jgi:acetyl esterase/lipase
MTYPEYLPELRQALADSPSRVGLTPADLARVRSELAASFPAASAEVAHTEVTVQGADGAQVSVQVHRPFSPDGRCPALVWLHGGGYVMGAPQMDIARLQRWVLEAGFVVVSPDYRLAPEHPFPAAIDDCTATLRWVAENANGLGVDPGRLLVGGISTGGGLAAALALRARDEGGPTLAGQILLFPMIDDRFGDNPSSAIASRLWGAQMNSLGWRCYLGRDTSREPDLSPYAAAARAESLAGLPTSFVAVAGLDVLRDEGLDYARRLVADGVSTELHLYPDTPHGFSVLAPAAPISRQLEITLSAFIRRAGAEPSAGSGKGRHVPAETTDPSPGS